MLMYGHIENVEAIGTTYQRFTSCNINIVEDFLIIDECVENVEIPFSHFSLLPTQTEAAPSVQSEPRHPVLQRGPGNGRNGYFTTG